MQHVDVNRVTEDPQSDTDAALARAAGVDRQAFLELYDRYVESIERFVAARTGSSEVEDLVSVTFLRALGNIHTYRPDRGSIGAWLFTIARHVVVDHYRDRARSISPQPVVAISPEQPGPEAVVLRWEEGRRVRTALVQLTVDQRDALALRYAADLPFAAVAASLGKSEAATKMLVQRGLHTMRRLLEKDTPHD
jgi:RNA polymerase sigma factor (sigma-70 family)